MKRELPNGLQATVFAGHGRRYCIGKKNATNSSAPDLNGRPGFAPALAPPPFKGPPQQGGAWRLRCVFPRAGNQFQPPPAWIPRQTAPTPRQGCTHRKAEVA